MKFTTFTHELRDIKKIIDDIKDQCNSELVKLRNAVTVFRNKLEIKEQIF